MKTFVCFADVHCDEMARGYSDVQDPETGLPCYIADVQRSMRWVGDVINSVENATAFFLGDMFHHKTHVSSAAMYTMGKAWSSLSCDKFCISGNHDVDGKMSLLAGFDGYADTPTILSFTPKRDKRVFVGLVPYAKPEEWLSAYRTVYNSASTQKSPLIMMGHQAMLGSRAPIGAGKEIRLEKGASVGEVSRTDRMVVLGDIHQPQQVTEMGRVFYCGGLLRRNLGDSGRRATMLLVRTDGETITHEWLDNPVSPRFAAVHCKTRDDISQVEQAMRQIQQEDIDVRRYVSLQVDRSLNPAAAKLVAMVQSWAGAKIVMRLSSAPRIKVQVNTNTALSKTTGSSVEEVVRSVVRSNSCPKGTYKTLMSLLSGAKGEVA